MSMNDINVMYYFYYDINFQFPHKSQNIIVHLNDHNQCMLYEPKRKRQKRSLENRPSLKVQ